MTWIQTYTNLVFDFVDIESNEIRIEDIAQALSNQCRFNGHTDKPYSIAQHSWMVSQAMERSYLGKSGPIPLLIGLLHDASEAYMGDCVRPLKQLLPEYQKIEAQVEAFIWKKFNLSDHVPECAPVVKKFDNRMLATERRDLLGGCPRGGYDWGSLEDVEPLRDVLVYPMPAMAAKKIFLERFEKLNQACFG